MSVGCTCIITHVAKTVKRNLFWQAVIFCGEIKKCFSVLVARNEPQANKKFFDPTIFSKMLARCGRAAHICGANNRTAQWKQNKNLGENRKNRNCLQNQEVVMRYKVSGAIVVPKASWGCAPALPNRIRVVFLGAKFPIMSCRQLKVF